MFPQRVWLHSHCKRAPCQQDVGDLKTTGACAAGSVQAKRASPGCMASVFGGLTCNPLLFPASQSGLQASGTCSLGFPGAARRRSRPPTAPGPAGRSVQTLPLPLPEAASFTAGMGGSPRPAAGWKLTFMAYHRDLQLGFSHTGKQGAVNLL